MKIREILTRRGMAGLGIAALTAGMLATIPTAAQALPQIQVDKTLNFGQVPVGEFKELDLTVKNNGNPAVEEDTALGLFVALPPGPPADTQFEVTANTCVVVNLQGGQSCTLTVRFTPQSADPTAATQPFFVQYAQDVDPTAGQDLQLVFRQASVTLVGNVLCAGVSPTIVGTLGNDDIVGTAGNDVIAALGGEDTVKADGGNDIVCGGGDGDLLSGGKGKDKLYGEGGSDVLKGGKGTDACIGGLSVDRAKKCEKVGSL